MKRKDFLKVSGLGMAGMMFSAPLLGRAFTRQELVSGSGFEVLVVGTGYGSAVTALRLAEAGKKVLMLEMGMDWEKSGIEFSGMVWAEKQSTWLRNTTVAPFGNYRLFEKFTGVLDREDFDGVKIYQGRGVGGGSLANGGMTVIPRRDYFEEIFPNLDSEAFYTKYYPMANTGLGGAECPEDFYQSTEYYQFSRTGEAEGANAGYEIKKVPNVYDWDYMQKEAAGEVPKSGLADEVIYGNNAGKKDLTKTYIKEALETGNVSILALHRVNQVIENDNGGYTLEVDNIDNKGEVVETKYFNTQKLFLGAGSLGTAKILLRSKAKGSLSKLDDTIGSRWGNNGNTMCSRGGVSMPLGGKQSGMPAAGLEKWTDGLDAKFAEIAPFPLGIDLRTALYLCISKVDKFGSIAYNEDTNDIDINWGSEQNAHMIKNAGDFLDDMIEANGGSRATAIFSNNGIDETICYHPLGGATIGVSTDMYGRLNNYDNLYVMDGSLIPGSLGVNPYLTITALAEYCIEEIIKSDFNDPAGDVVIADIPTVNVYPNPFYSYVNVDLYSAQAGTVKITFNNVWYGGEVYSKDVQVVEGQNSIVLDDVSSLKWGNYTIAVTAVNGTQFTQKVRKR